MKLFPIKTSFCLTLLCFFALNNTNAQEGQVILNQDRAIAELLDLKKEMNKDSNEYYKIQIYSGDRTGAQEAQKEFHLAFENWKSRLEYESPNFKLSIELEIRTSSSTVSKIISSPIQPVIRMLTTAIK